MVDASSSVLDRQLTPLIAGSPAILSSTVAHPTLAHLNAECIRVFLRQYDSYVNEVKTRIESLVGDSATRRPDALKFCVDSELVYSMIGLNFVKARSYDAFDDSTLRAYLASKLSERSDCVSLESLDALIEKKLRTDMSDNSAPSRMENLFISYIAILRRHGLSWLSKINPKMAVQQILSAKMRENLRGRLQSDIGLRHLNLENDPSAFMSHSISVAKAFEMVDIVPKSNEQGFKSDSTSSSTKKSSASKSAPPTAKTQAPLCLYKSHRERGLRHLLRDCRACPDDQLEQLMTQHRANKKRDGPAANTRSRSNTYQQHSISSAADKPKKVGRLQKEIQDEDTPYLVSLPVSIFGDMYDISHTVTGRCDDGSDVSLISPRIAEAAVIAGIGKIRRIKTVELTVALNAGEDPSRFSFSRAWKCPRTILHPSAGQLASLHLEFLIVDDALTCEDLLIGLPVLRHLKVDTKTLLEQNRAALDGTDCSAVTEAPMYTKLGNVGRLMRTRADKDNTNHTELDAKRPTVSYYAAHNEEDPFQDPSLIHSRAGDDEEIVRRSIEDMVLKSSSEGLPKEIEAELRQMADSHSQIFCTTFSGGSPADVSPLHVNLTPNAKPVRVRLRNYSPEQRQFLRSHVEELIKCNMIYLNPSATWASAPLLVPKPGPSHFHFTVDLRPASRYTTVAQYSMPNLEHKWTKTSGSRYFAVFDLSNGYWQFPLADVSQDCQSFITPDGIYTPRRVLHGTTNAFTYL